MQHYIKKEGGGGPRIYFCRHSENTQGLLKKKKQFLRNPV